LARFAVARRFAHARVLSGRETVKHWTETTGAAAEPRGRVARCLFKFPLSVYTLIEAALKTKSHKADGWYEMYGRCKIDTTEDAVFLDLDFDYGS
jgi:hypothetical protein